MSLSNGYQLVEPHPSTPSTGYLHTGRGGAGNKVHVSNVSHGPTATSRASVTSLESTGPRGYRSGRGGAGNVHYTIDAERMMFSFDEELERQMQQERDIAPVYHIGRGGHGNIASSGSNLWSYPSVDKSRSDTELSIVSSASSTSRTESKTSDGSGNSRLRRILEKGWWKIKGVGDE